MRSFSPIKKVLEEIICSGNLGALKADDGDPKSLPIPPDLHQHISKMGLVDYTDSETSDTEPTPGPPPAPKATSKNSSKPTFQKVVDRSNPHKIRVSLPNVSKEEVQLDADADERATKRVRTGGGAFSGFNSFLPAPKRASQSANGGPQDVQGRKRGLGSGVNLKTGATPGFSREPEPEPDILRVEADSDQQTVKEDLGPQAEVAKRSGQEEGSGIIGLEKPKQSIVPIGTPMMFKPLSVARKPQNKKAPVLKGSSSTTTDATPATKPAKAVPTVSLFSMNEEHTEAHIPISSKGEYKPLVYDTAQVRADSPEPEPLTDPQVNEDANLPSFSTHDITLAHGTSPQSLDSIASDLNLSASAKRQLLGRHRNSKTADSSAINIVNFNTDEEYAANEAIRAAGEQVQHNPVRAIAAGKHSLKQLVNAANNQKDALEEHFASGKRNKKEAGSKYGW